MHWRRHPLENGSSAGDSRTFRFVLHMCRPDNGLVGVSTCPISLARKPLDKHVAIKGRRFLCKRQAMKLHAREHTERSMFAPRAGHIDVLCEETSARQNHIASAVSSLITVTTGEHIRKLCGRRQDMFYCAMERGQVAPSARRDIEPPLKQNPVLTAMQSLTGVSIPSMLRLCGSALRRPSTRNALALLAFCRQKGTCGVPE